MTVLDPIRRLRGSVIALTVAWALAACATQASPSQSQPTPSGTAAGAVDQVAAEAYCTDKGGQLVDRVATWNTNGDASTWLQMAGRWRLCEFETGTGDATTRISVDLVTLYSEEPTLAAIAYLAKVPPVLPPQVGQNPAQYSCSQGLGGASGFGNTAAGGGWVDASQPVFIVVNMCVFADGSAIDEFGIFYYADGAIRGADLAPILRYQPGGQLPAIYDTTPP